MDIEYKKSGCSFLVRFILTFCLVFLVSCGSGSGGDNTPSIAPDTPPKFHGTLTESDLMGDVTPGLTQMQHFEAPSDALAPYTQFSGLLKFSQTQMTTSVRAEYDGSYSSHFFPEFSIELLSNGDDIFPIQRNIISTWGSGTSFWDVVVGSGKIWMESDDSASWHRASIPITLVSRKVGQVRNCVAIFLYTVTTVSKSYVQCSQETSPIDSYTPGDLRVLVDTSYMPGSISNEAQEIADYQTEIAGRLPVRPWSDIVSSDPDILDTFNRDLTEPHYQSLGALVIDGEIYRQDPLTRHGSYPYPDDMRHGVFSVTKSLSAALSLLFLAERYGDSIFDALISDYVPGLSGHPGWQGVTFEQTLNMVTGVTGGDEGALIVPFIEAVSAEDGIAAIANLGDAPSSPGELFNYASTNTFVLSYGMQQYVEAQEGTGTFYWDLIVENVLRPIEVYNFPIQKTLELGGAEGIPIMGWGAFPTADDTAKIASLFKNEGYHNGEQLLHAERTREATNRSLWPGYEVGDGRSYQHSFWLHTFNLSGCSFKVPFMLGHGANYVGMTPGGISIIRFMDYNEYDPTPLVRAAESVVESC